MRIRKPVSTILLVIGCGGSLTDLGDASSGDSGSDGTTTDATDEDATSSPCGKGQTLCGNTCFVNDVDHCGASCVQCGAPAHGQATCDGTSCGFTCDVLQCGQTCVVPDTDAHNCGVCGHDCLGTQCAGGVCAPQNLYLMSAIGGIAVDGTNLYWASGPTVYQGPKGGSATPTLLVTNSGWTQYKILVDANNVYFSTFANVYSIPIGGGTLHVYPIDTPSPTVPAIDSQNVYYASASPNGTVTALPIDGGTPLTLLHTTNPTQTTIARAGSYVYFASHVNNAPPELWRTSASVPDAGASLLFADDASTTEIYAISSAANGDVYFGGTTNLYDLAIDGGVTAVAAGFVSALVVDATNVYFTLYNGNTFTIERMPIGGGTLTPIVTGPPGGAANSLAVDGTYLYYPLIASQISGIYRVVK